MQHSSMIHLPITVTINCLRSIFPLLSSMMQEYSPFWDIATLCKYSVPLLNTVKSVEVVWELSSAMFDENEEWIGRCPKPMSGWLNNLSILCSGIGFVEATSVPSLSQCVIEPGLSKVEHVKALFCLKNKCVFSSASSSYSVLSGISIKFMSLAGRGKAEKFCEHQNLNKIIRALSLNYKIYIPEDSIILYP